MNARAHTFDFLIEGQQVDDVVSSVLHTLLFHRTLGKFRYYGLTKYEEQTVDFEDVDCNFVDFTYVRVASEKMIQTVSEKVREFSNAIRSAHCVNGGQIALQFCQRKRSMWPFSDTILPWEIWTLKVRLTNAGNEYACQLYKEKVAGMLKDAIMFIAMAMNKNDFLPTMPAQPDLDLIFDTSFPNVQPYLFQITQDISRQLPHPSLASVIKDTLFSF